MKFKVALYASEEGYSVCVPALPGCWSQGATSDEALANITDAIREYLEAEIPPQDGAEVREVEFRRSQASNLTNYPARRPETFTS